MSNKLRFNCRLNENTIHLIKKLSVDGDCSQSEIISRAVKEYAEKQYSPKSFTAVTDTAAAVAGSIVSGMEHRLNNRSNQLLSSMAIEIYILQRIVAENLDVDFQKVLGYEDEARLAMTEKNRLFELDEIL